MSRSDRFNNADKIFAVDNGVIDADSVGRAFVKRERAEVIGGISADYCRFGKNIVGMLFFDSEKLLIETVFVLDLLIVNKLLGERIYFLVKFVNLLLQGR